jgi:4-hydroxy-2-oxoheptanedioate aldolase
MARRRIITRRQSSFLPRSPIRGANPIALDKAPARIIIIPAFTTIRGHQEQADAVNKPNVQRESFMKTKMVLLAGMAAAMLTVISASAQQAVPPSNANVPEMPKATTRTGKHVNRVIDMWLKGQPVYYAQISGGGYEEGKKMAATKADYITYEMEHGPLDFKELREFMRGLVDAGPTRTGHRTPAVIVTLPISGTTDALRANAWMIQQTLATGVHGILLCNAESPEAARLMIEAARYPFAPRVEGLAQGTRGNGSQGYASGIWGVTAQEYMRIADPWPINPDGEFLFGLKIENPRADANVETSVRVPGIAFAEWGPGDHGFFIMGRPGTYQGGGEASPEMAAVRRRVLNATKAAGIKFLNACTENNVIDQIKDGAMICTGGDSPAADKGRAYTKRTDPW